MPVLTALLLAAAPPTVHRFIHSLHGAPVAEIELRRTGQHYEYVSRHFFRRGATSVERLVPSSSDNPTWASEALTKPRKALGCSPVEDERTRAKGELCLTQAGEQAAGTLLGQPFLAWYEKNLLQRLELGDSTFVRSDQPVQFKDPFGSGFALTGQGAALALSPAVKGARQARPTPAGKNEDCAAAAHAYVTAHPDFEVVLGLVEDGGRGWPHAWVKHRSTAEELDPSRPEASAYLALPKAQAARIYLDLLGKRRSLLRVVGP